MTMKYVCRERCPRGFACVVLWQGHKQHLCDMKACCNLLRR
jgi:hypothetical protein